jgi:hypothetical protein
MLFPNRRDSAIAIIVVDVVVIELRGRTMCVLYAFFLLAGLVEAFPFPPFYFPLRLGF